MEINPSGNWSHEFWTAELKSSLKENENNEQIGEKLVLENEQFKVWTIHLLAGRSLPFHKHCKPYFYTALSAGKSRSFYGDGRITETGYEVGITAYFDHLNQENFFIHNLENIGNTTLIFSTIEFKK